MKNVWIHLEFSRALAALAAAVNFQFSYSRLYTLNRIWLKWGVDESSMSFDFLRVILVNAGDFFFSKLPRIRFLSSLQRRKFFLFKVIFKEVFFFLLCSNENRVGMKKKKISRRYFFDIFLVFHSSQPVLLLLLLVVFTFFSSVVQILLVFRLLDIFFGPFCFYSARFCFPSSFSSVSPEHRTFLSFLFPFRISVYFSTVWNMEETEWGEKVFFFPFFLFCTKMYIYIRHYTQQQRRTEPYTMEASSRLIDST